MSKYTEKEMPTSADIFEMIRNVKSIQTLEDAEKSRESFFDLVTIVKYFISLYCQTINNENDADIVMSRLLRLHEINGGMIGYCEAIYEKSHSLHCKLAKKEVNDPEAKTKELSEAAKKVIADGEVADLKGLRKDLEESQKNLWERIQIVKYQLRSY